MLHMSIERHTCQSSHSDDEIDNTSSQLETFLVQQNRTILYEKIYTRRNTSENETGVRFGYRHVACRRSLLMHLVTSLPGRHSINYKLVLSRYDIHEILLTLALKNNVIHSHSHAYLHVCVADARVALPTLFLSSFLFFFISDLIVKL